MSDESLTSRRSFFRTAGIGGLLGTPIVAGAGHDGTYNGNERKTFDFTKKSGQLQPDKIVDSACQFCNSLCRLKVHVKDGRIIDVLGEEADPVQAAASA
jgi:formate dehydrogenase (coenzyme F420) alpha subunit